VENDLQLRGSYESLPPCSDLQRQDLLDSELNMIPYDTFSSASVMSFLFGLVPASGADRKVETIFLFFFEIHVL